MRIFGLVIRTKKHDEQLASEMVGKATGIGFKAGWEASINYINNLSRLSSESCQPFIMKQAQVILEIKEEKEGEL